MPCRWPKLRTLFITQDELMGSASEDSKMMIATTSQLTALRSLRVSSGACTVLLLPALPRPKSPVHRASVIKWQDFGSDYDLDADIPPG